MVIIELVLAVDTLLEEADRKELAALQQQISIKEKELSDLETKIDLLHTIISQWVSSVFIGLGNINLVSGIQATNWGSAGWQTQLWSIAHLYGGEVESWRSVFRWTRTQKCWKWFQAEPSPSHSDRNSLHEGLPNSQR